MLLILITRETELDYLYTKSSKKYNDSHYYAYHSALSEIQNHQAKCITSVVIQALEE